MNNTKIGKSESRKSEPRKFEWEKIELQQYEWQTLMPSRTVWTPSPDHKHFEMHNNGQQSIEKSPPIKTVQIDGITIPEGLLPHIFLYQCTFCKNELGDLDFPITEVYNCPKCGMNLNKRPSDQAIVAMMGGYEYLLMIHQHYVTKGLIQ